MRPTSRHTVLFYALPSRTEFPESGSAIRFREHSHLKKNAPMTGAFLILDDRDESACLPGSLQGFHGNIGELFHGDRNA
jgi:hypothetical protein